jgi:hypothetical protein
MNEFEDERVLAELEGIHQLLEVLIAQVELNDCCKTEKDEEEESSEEE